MFIAAFVCVIDFYLATIQLKNIRLTEMFCEELCTYKVFYFVSESEIKGKIDRWLVCVCAFVGAGWVVACECVCRASTTIIRTKRNEENWFSVWHKHAENSAEHSLHTAWDKGHLADQKWHCHPHNLRANINVRKLGCREAGFLWADLNKRWCSEQGVQVTRVCSLWVGNCKPFSALLHLWSICCLSPCAVCHFWTLWCVIGRKREHAFAYFKTPHSKCTIFHNRVQRIYCDLNCTCQN